MAFRRKRDYPRVIYGPYGASMTIDGPDEWIDGWTERPEGRGSGAPRSEAKPVPYTRAELKRRLRQSGASFDENSADAELWRRLQHYS
jgi:hypothetical protein